MIEEQKTDESKHIINLVIKDKLKKEAEELIQRFEMANSMNCFMQLTPDRKQIGEMLVMIAEPREKRIEELEKKIKRISDYLAYKIPHELMNEATNKIWNMI